MIIVTKKAMKHKQKIVLFTITFSDAWWIFLSNSVDVCKFCYISFSEVIERSLCKSSSQLSRQKQQEPLCRRDDTNPAGLCYYPNDPRLTFDPINGINGLKQIHMHGYNNLIEEL